MTKSTRATPRQATSTVAFPGEPPEDSDPLLAFTPYLHKAPRSNSITPDLQRRFVATLAATGIVKQAARSIGKSLEALYKLRRLPGAEGFAGAWDAALERGAQRLEDIAMERAITGTRTPIVSHGKILGHWDKPDNALLRFMLQHRVGGRYARDAEVGPGHPAYERIKHDFEEAQRKRANDPERIEEIRRSIDRKVEQWRRDFVDIWNAQIAEWTRENGGVVPQLTYDSKLATCEDGRKVIPAPDGDAGKSSS